MSIRALFPSRRELLILVAVLALAALAGGVILPPPAEAAAKCGTEWRFYSDATYSQLVGIRGWTSEACGCEFYTSGSFSIYREDVTSWC